MPERETSQSRYSLDPKTHAKHGAAAKSGASDTTPIISGVVSAVVGAVLIGLGLWLRRRRNGQNSNESSQPLPSKGRDLEHDLGLEPHTGAGFGTARILGDGGHPSVYNSGVSHPLNVHEKAVPQASNDDGAVAASNATTAGPAPKLESGPVPPASAAVAPQQASPKPPEQENGPGKDLGLVLGSGDVKDSAAEQSWTVTMSTANMSTAEQAELGQFNKRVASAASAIDEGTPGDTSSSMSGRRGSRGGIDVGEAVMEAAQNLALHCQIPGVSEAAAVVSTLVTLVSDSRDLKSAVDSNLRKCRSIVRVLERASKVAGKVGVRGPRISRRFVSPARHGRHHEYVVEGHDGMSENAKIAVVAHEVERVQAEFASSRGLRRVQTIFTGAHRSFRPYIVGVQGGETTTAEQRDLIEEVHYAVEDLVELIMTYQSKNKLSKVLMSTSFKRRQDDLEAAIDRALGRLQVSSRN